MSVARTRLPVLVSTMMAATALQTEAEAPKPAPATNAVDLTKFDCRDPRQAAEALRAMSRALVEHHGWARPQARIAARGWVKMRAKEAPDQPRKLGASHFEAIEALRTMPIPAQFDDTIDEIDARRERNARKRARKQRSSR